MGTIPPQRRSRVAPHALRGFMNGYYTGITVVTAVDAQDRPHGLTCNSLVSATLDPPTLLVCLDNRTGTLAAVRESGAFAVNLLAEGGQEAAEIFASRAPDRFAAVNWERSPSGLPRLVDDAFAVAECVVTHMHTVGDHVVVFGLVHDIDGEPASPLLYGMRAFTKPSHPPPPDLVATSQVSGRR